MLDIQDILNKKLRDKVKEIEEDWVTAFTDPKNHDYSEGGKFCYLVHTILTHDFVKEIVKEKIHKGNYDKSQDIDLLKNPLNISKKNIVCMSAINQNHMETYALIGLILEVPPKNILNVSSEDCYTDLSDHKGVISKGRQNLCKVNHLMLNTERGIYNEVVAIGKGIKVKGFMIKTDVDGNPSDKEGAEIIEKFAKQYNLPIVYLGKKIREEKKSLLKNILGIFKIKKELTQKVS